MENRNLYRRLRYWAVGGILLTGLVIGGIFTWLLHHNQVQALEDKLHCEAELQVRALESELARLAGIATQITSRTRIRQELERYNRGEIDLAGLRVFSTPKLMDPMRLIPDLLGITRLDGNGDTTVQVGVPIPADRWPEPAGSGLGIPFQTDGGGRMIVRAPIMNRNGEQVGTDLVLFDTGRLAEMLSGFHHRHPDVESVFLAAMDRDRVATFLGQDLPPRDSMPNALLRAQLTEALHSKTIETGQHPLAIGSRSFLVVHDAVGSYPWVLFLLGRAADIHAPAYRHSAYTALALLLLILMGSLFAYGFIRPLSDRLIAHTENLARLLADNSRLLDAVQADKALLQSILDNTPSVIYVKDTDGRYKLVNRAYERFRDLPRGRMIGKTDHEIFPREIADHFRENDLAVLSAGKALESDERAPHPDGMHDYLSVKFPLRGAGGEIEALCGISTDITERKAAEERLRLSAKVFESSGEGLVITDADGDIVDVNPAFCHIMGYAKDEVVGRNPRLWKSDVHDVEFFRDMWDSLCAGRQWRGEVWNRTKAGAPIPVQLTIDAVLDERGEVQHYVVVYSDISSLKKSQEELEYLAHYDVLTGLPNRVLFNARLEHALERAERVDGKLAVIFLDLDQFKHINDSLGHNIGDQLLTETATLLRQQLRKDDTVARIGGDEFTFLLEEVTDADDVILVVDRILHAFDTELLLAGNRLRITPSLGISIYPQDGMDVDTLVRNADSAMYRAKAEGRNTYQFYTESLTAHALERMRLEAGLRKALDEDELELLYQPQIALESGRLASMEVLVRWRHPEEGLVLPDKFIPIAEDIGLIHQLDDWVMRHAVAQGAAWLAQGLPLGTIAVNVSGKSISRGGLAHRVEGLLQTHRLPSRHLEIELTEGFFMGRSSREMAELDQLRSLGVTLAVDDFGTGYSSLAYLKTLPLNRLKIDKSFIQDIPEDMNDVAITQAIIALGRSLGLELVAEGVETEAQKAFLIGNGCGVCQGYLFSRPIPAQAMIRWLRDAKDAQAETNRRPTWRA